MEFFKDERQIYFAKMNEKRSFQARKMKTQDMISMPALKKILLS